VRKGTVKNINPGKRTTGVMNSKLSDADTRDWDKKPGLAQHGVAARAALGQKKTPRGPGTLRKGR
jgi:hypothetical protein